MRCPKCDSNKIVKNGSLTNGKQKYKCKACRRQLVLNPKKHRISDETKALIEIIIRAHIFSRYGACH